MCRYFGWLLVTVVSPDNGPRRYTAGMEVSQKEPPRKRDLLVCELAGIVYTSYVPWLRFPICATWKGMCKYCKGLIVAVCLSCHATMACKLQVGSTQHHIAELQTSGRGSDVRSTPGSDDLRVGRGRDWPVGCAPTATCRSKL